MELRTPCSAACGVILTLAVAVVPGWAAPQFTDVGAALTPVVFGSTAWGDYDNDGDLDLLVTGSAAGSAVSIIYRNDAGTFVDTLEPLTGVSGGDAAWGDYDNDGLLDIVLAGTGSTSDVAKVYHNDGGGTFTDALAGLTGVGASSVAWGDYDNDGDLDILISGIAVARITRIYRNDGGSFTDAGAGLPGVYSGSAAWGDYDGDEDLDILLTGIGNTGDISRVYRNDGDGFTDIGADIEAVGSSSAAWGDFDNDGDLDIVLAGKTPGGARITRVYRNDDGTFENSGASLLGASGGSVAWGDFDNDGDLDLVVVGDYGFGYIAEVYSNDGAGTFTNIGTGLTGVYLSCASWGDYDGDRDLDLVMAGVTNSSGTIARVYRNNSSTANTIPPPPTDLHVDTSAAGVLLRWRAPADAQTPENGLSYNVRVGTSPGGMEVIGSMSNLTTGSRRLPAMGNAGPGTGVLLAGLRENTTYYWSVQAVDTAFAGSHFAAEGQFLTTFTDTGAELPALYNGGVAWGDYDGDGDLDLALTGSHEHLLTLSRIYRNDGGGAFTNIDAALEPMEHSALAWADYDNDGDLDLALAGEKWGPTVALTRVYRNDGGGLFSEAPQALAGVRDGTVAWGDYNNDGLMDLLVAGYTTHPSAGWTTRLYRNAGGSEGFALVEVNTGLPDVWHASAAWGDYDNDGDLDLVLIGWDGTKPIARIYRNDGNAVFVDAQAGLPGVFSGGAAWGDYDNDGDLDLVLTGTGQTERIAKIFRRDTGNTFTDIHAALTPVSGGTAAWGDADNDGDLDLLITGQKELFLTVTAVYRNDGGVFTDTHAALTGVTGSSAAWGDFDGDEDLDLAVIGSAGSFDVGLVYSNEAPVPNGRPSQPSGLSATNLGTSIFGSTVRLSWHQSVDAHTPSAGLSYNVRVGTAPGAADIVCAMSAPSGLRLLPSAGNAQLGPSAFVRGLTLGTRYYWSVQAVDPGFRGSTFSEETSFVTVRAVGQSSRAGGAFLIVALAFVAAVSLLRRASSNGTRP